MEAAKRKVRISSGLMTDLLREEQECEVNWSGMYALIPFLILKDLGMIYYVITNSFYMVLAQIKEKDPDVVIPDIFNSKEPSTSGVGIDDVRDDIYDEI
ncbi:hypothetical protein COLO4_34395 [Corchorus olitorius]|uniref:Uncharacterized protein n=1 Tax=Corchorus olitorius TaxID=93759 RepID=A0A1R3GL19_9ROSI|nr:hypothetical protein COLO4_34395 [Corchorus olitorius]